MNINCICLNLRQMSSKNYAIFWGGGGEVIKRSHWITGGRGGGQDGPKKDHIIFERSLNHKYYFDCLKTWQLANIYTAVDYDNMCSDYDNM